MLVEKTTVIDGRKVRELGRLNGTTFYTTTDIGDTARLYFVCKSGNVTHYLDAEGGTASDDRTQVEVEFESIVAVGE